MRWRWVQNFVLPFDGPAYAVLDRPDMPLVAWNAAAHEDLLWAHDEVVGRPVYDVVRPATENGPTQESAFQQLLRCGWWAGSAVLLDRLGHPHNYDGTCCRVWSNMGELYFVTVLFASDELHQIAGTMRKGVKANSSHIAEKKLHGMPHVARRATGRRRAAGASFRAMSAAEISDHKVLVGRTIKLARETRGKTQQQLAHKVGFRGEHAHSVIAGYELGDHMPRWDRQERIAEALGIEEGAIWFHRPQTEVPDEPKGWQW